MRLPDSHNKSMMFCVAQAGNSLLLIHFQSYLPDRFPPGVRIGFHGPGPTVASGSLDVPDDTLQGKVLHALLVAHVKNLYVSQRPELAEGTIEFIITSNPDANPTP